MEGEENKAGSDKEHKHKTDPELKKDQDKEDSAHHIPDKSLGFGKDSDSTNAIVLYESDKYIIYRSDCENTRKVIQEGNHVEGDMAGRDINKNVTNNFIELAINEQEDIGIIEDIFTFISTELKTYTATSKKEDSTLKHLSEKIRINFTSSQVETITGIFNNMWARKMLVSKFIEELLETEDGEQTILALKDDIQCNFMKAVQSDSTNVALNDIHIFSGLAKFYLPESKSKNVAYLANAKAIVLYFFEFCDIGKKTDHDGSSSQQLGLSL